jgi:hypothetical protein
MIPRTRTSFLARTRINGHLTWSYMHTPREAFGRLQHYPWSSQGADGVVRSRSGAKRLQESKQGAT